MSLSSVANGIIVSKNSIMPFRGEDKEGVFLDLIDKSMFFGDAARPVP